MSKSQYSLDEWRAHVAGKQAAVVKANRAALKAGPQPKAKKRRKPPGHEESDIQCECVAWFRLQYKGYLLLSFANGGHLAGTPKQRAIQMRILKKEGLLAGAADLVAFLPGKMLFLECKTAKGRQSDDQKWFEQRATDLGYAYHVFRSLEEFQVIISQATQS